jgi:Na+/melibiose symporter-like transporter
LNFVSTSLNAQTQRLTTARLAGFASPTFALAALGLPVVAILPPLYAELGIGLTVVGAIFMTARFFDVFTDPIFGVLGDRVRTRWGRRRPAVVAGVPILLVGAVGLFLPSDPASESTLLISLLVLYLGWTLLTLSHTAWASELSPDYDERSRIMGALQFAGLIGAVVVLAIPTLVDYMNPQADMRLRSELMGWLIFISLPVLCAVALFSAKEPPVHPPTDMDWRRAWGSILDNVALRRLLLADLLMGLQGGINGSVHFFFIIHVLLLPQAASLYLVVIFLTGLVCVPLFVKLSVRFGKHPVLCYGALQSSLATGMFFFVPSGSFWWVFVIYVLVGINFGAKDLLMRSIMADVIDQDRVNVGADRSALYYSMLTLTSKVGAALAVGIMYPVLDWVGFDPSIKNDQATLDGVRWVVAASPTLVTLAVAAIMWRFPIGREEQRALRAQIDAARHAGAGQ